MKEAFGESVRSQSKGLHMPKIEKRHHNPYHENHLAAIKLRR
jgi:hypothetical protein